MIQENKTALVKLEIERLVDSGITNIQEIYTIVCDKYGMQRPAVRRSKRELVKRLLESTDGLLISFTNVVNDLLEDKIKELQVKI